MSPPLVPSKEAMISAALKVYWEEFNKTSCACKDVLKCGAFTQQAEQFWKELNKDACPPQCPPPQGNNLSSTGGGGGGACESTNTETPPPCQQGESAPSHTVQSLSKCQNPPSPQVKPEVPKKPTCGNKATTCDGLEESSKKTDASCGTLLAVGTQGSVEVGGAAVEAPPPPPPKNASCGVLQVEVGGAKTEAPPPEVNQLFPLAAAKSGCECACDCRAEEVSSVVLVSVKVNMASSAVPSVADAVCGRSSCGTLLKEKETRGGKKGRSSSSCLKKKKSGKGAPVDALCGRSSCMTQEASELFAVEDFVCPEEKQSGAAAGAPCLEEVEPMEEQAVTARASCVTQEASELFAEEERSVGGAEVGGGAEEKLQGKKYAEFSKWEGDGGPCDKCGPCRGGV